MARGGFVGAVLRPANFRLYRNVKRFRKPLVKALSKCEKGKLVATAGRRSRRVPRRHLQGQAVRNGNLAMAIISTFMSFVSVCICRCAPCCVTVLRAKGCENCINYTTEKKTALPKALREV